MRDLIQALIAQAQELAERFADDRAECRDRGSFDGALQAAKAERKARRIIRAARRILARQGAA